MAGLKDMGNKQEILVSIVIPTYNRRNVISRAIDSCLRQTYNAIEIVVCDDHSNDGTLDYLKDKYKSVNNIRYCMPQAGKKGANAARNEGVRNATGRFIAFLDSDDYLLENSIEVRLNCLLNTKCGLVYGNVYTKPYNSEKLSLVQYMDISECDQRKYLAQELSLCITSSIMIRKCVFDMIGELDESLQAWQDDDLVFCVGMRYRMLHCKENVAVICSSRKSIWGNKENVYRGCKKIIEKHKEEIIKYDSYIRYCMWKIRSIAFWAKYKEQDETLYIRKVIYGFVYNIINNSLKAFFKHI